MMTWQINQKKKYPFIASLSRKLELHSNDVFAFFFRSTYDYIKNIENLFSCDTFNIVKICVYIL